MAATDGGELDVLLEYLKTNRGFDFSGYKRATIERRVAKRMEAVELGSYLDYLDYLEVHPEEFPQLFNTILINVTGFFRDEGAWQYLREAAIPPLLEHKGPEGPIRVWVAGCSSGEEAYTIAMVLADALGEEQYLGRVKVYATDVDSEALDDARLATYDAKAMEPVPAELRERFFERTGQRSAFRRDLRRTVIFGRNDLVQDAPISRVDLLLCRNTLMYFNAETQAQILRRFHFALNPFGFLFLGKSEMLITHADLFKPVDLKRRVFTKVASNLRDRLLFATSGANDEHVDEVIRGSAFDATPVAQVVVDHDTALVQANLAARRMLQLGPGDMGRPIKDLRLSYRPADVRGPLEGVLRGGPAVTLPMVEMTVGDVTRTVEVAIAPLLAGDESIGASLTYVDQTVARLAQEELETTRRELDAAYEELQSTVEELETTNEELQSTNEELETTNEELQSTNEELETMNEELQSSNEELETMNDELRKRSLELNEVNAFMETILTSLGTGVMVVDREQTVRVFNQHSQDQWGLRPDEAEGQHVLNLDIGLPVDALRQPLRSVLNGSSERETLELDAVDRRGRSHLSRVTVLPLSLPADGVTGAIVLTERGQLDGE